MCRVMGILDVQRLLISLILGPFYEDTVYLEINTGLHYFIQCLKDYGWRSAYGLVYLNWVDNIVVIQK